MILSESWILYWMNSNIKNKWMNDTVPHVDEYQIFMICDTPVDFEQLGSYHSFMRSQNQCYCEHFGVSHNDQAIEKVDGPRISYTCSSRILFSSAWPICLIGFLDLLIWITQTTISGLLLRGGPTSSPTNLLKATILDVIEGWCWADPDMYLLPRSCQGYPQNCV